MESDSQRSKVWDSSSRVITSTNYYIMPKSNI